MNKHLSLIVPLLKYADAPVGSKKLALSYQGLDDCLWQLMGYKSQAALPIAALTYQQEIGHLTKNDWVMRIDPVHLRLDRQAAYLLDADFIGISYEEADALIKSIHDYQDDFRIEMKHPSRWYIRQQQAIDLDALRLEQIRGANVTSALPTGASALQWLKVANEVQMLFHQHPINQQRFKKGQPEINSLWSWGAGQLPVVPQSAWQQVFSQQILSQSLAAQQKINTITTVCDVQTVLEQMPTGASLVHLDLNDDQQIDIWQQDWLVPLQQALQDKYLDSVHLYSETQVYHLKRKHWFSRFF